MPNLQYRKNAKSVPLQRMRLLHFGARPSLPMVGSCIGQRNHIYFYFYCWVTKIVAIYVLTLNAYMITHNNDVKIDLSDENFMRLTGA